MKRGPGRHSPSGTRNPPGSKVARKALEHRGLTWGGEVFHSGELTKASRRRRLERLGFQTIDISNGDLR